MNAKCHYEHPNFAAVVLVEKTADRGNPLLASAGTSEHFANHVA